MLQMLNALSSCTLPILDARRPTRAGVAMFSRTAQRLRFHGSTRDIL